MDYMASKLGAWQSSGGTNKGKVKFRIFFPSEADGLNHQIKSIKVVGDFQKSLGCNSDWEPQQGFPLSKTAHPEGEIWEYESVSDLKKGFYEYKYCLEYYGSNELRWVSDPCARYGGSKNMNAAFTIGGSTPDQNAIAELEGGRKDLRDLVIYEMMIDDFTDEYREHRAPLDAICDKLDYLEDLGINAILFMPWTAWNDEKFNWGYTPALYYAVCYRYANDLTQPAEKISWLKKLISECHKRGIHVIMDGVFNHVYKDFPYKSFYKEKDNDCPYAGQFGGVFGDLQDLDFHKNCTNEFILDVCKYWIDNFKIDGIRFDNTVNFHSDDYRKGLPKLLNEINTYVNQQGINNFSLTLEHMDVSAINVTKYTKANSYWDDSLHKECFNGLWSNSISPKLLDSLNHNRYLIGTGNIPTIYLGNHDHSHVTWRAGARDNQGSAQWYKVQPYVIALMTSPGAPMIQNGEEFAEDHWMLENDEGTSRRVQARPLHWSYHKDNFGRKLLELYKKLIKFRKSYNALRSDEFYPVHWENWQHQFNEYGIGLDSGRKLINFRRSGMSSSGVREEFVIVLNFSDREQWLDVCFPENGQWTDILSDANNVISVNNYQCHTNVSSYYGCIFKKN